jgi:hypothetical protein
MDKFVEWALIGAIAVLVTMVLVSIPFAMIWSLNTLFSLGIEYTIWTWLAALFVITVVGSRGYKS